MRMDMVWTVIVNSSSKVKIAILAGSYNTYYGLNPLPVKINYYEIFTLEQTDASMKTGA